MIAPSRRLRIALAIGVYEPDFGGAAEWLRAYARWLQGRGHEVWLVCQRSEAAESDGITVLTLPKDQQTENSWHRAGTLQKLVEGQSFDVVHDSGCLRQADVFHPLMGSLIHNWGRQLKAYPTALRLRRWLQIRLWRDVRLQLHQQRRPQILVACSKRVAADFARLGCTEAKVIRNGIPLVGDLPAKVTEALRRRLNVGSRLLVLVTATNFYLKGVMKVLEAVMLLSVADRKKYLFVITGRATNPVFQNYIDRHHIGDDCKLAGWVEQIDAYYQAADIFLHPTYHDAGSLSTLKALAAGCAVVTSQFDGSADWITDGADGLVLKDPGDAREIVKVLLRLQDENLRKRLGMAARELAPRLNEENQFRQLEELYGYLNPNGRQIA